MFSEICYYCNSPSAVICEDCDFRFYCLSCDEEHHWRQIRGDHRRSLMTLCQFCAWWTRKPAALYCRTCPAKKGTRGVSLCRACCDKEHRVRASSSKKHLLSPIFYGVDKEESSLSVRQWLQHGQNLKPDIKRPAAEQENKSSPKASPLSKPIPSKLQRSKSDGGVDLCRAKKQRFDSDDQLDTLAQALFGCSCQRKV
jgi:hypothetical protein